MAKYEIWEATSDPHGYDVGEVNDDGDEVWDCVESFDSAEAYIEDILRQVTAGSLDLDTNYYYRLVVNEDPPDTRILDGHKVEL